MVNWEAGNIKNTWLSSDYQNGHVQFADLKKTTFPLKGIFTQNKSISNWTSNSEGSKDNFYPKVLILEILMIFFFFNL